MTEKRRRGRRPGSPGSRDLILAAARTEFEQRGYDATTVRAIAASAKVDPAMIHHYFGTKEKLFLAALEIPFAPTAVASSIAGGPRESLGERAVKTFLSIWEDRDARGPLLLLLRSAMTNEAAAALLRQFVTRTVLSRIVVAFGDKPQAELRAEAMVSHLIGMAIIRYVVKVEPLASVSDAEVVALIGPVLQHYLDDDSGPSTSSS